MKVKLNIIEPWEYGTESPIDASVVKYNGLEFLLYLDFPRKIEQHNAQYFICKFKNDKDKISFKNKVKGSYIIEMVFDKQISSANDEIPAFGTYRGNFLSGELVIKNGG